MANRGLRIRFENGRRVQRCIAFHRPSPNDNGYAFPIDGLMVHVDVDSLEVLHVEDFGEWPLATERGNYDVESWSRTMGHSETT